MHTALLLQNQLFHQMAKIFRHFTKQLVALLRTAVKPCIRGALLNHSHEKQKVATAAGSGAGMPALKAEMGEQAAQRHPAWIPPPGGREGQKPSTATPHNIAFWFPPIS